MGTQVIVPYRDEDEARVFKPMGDLGQIVRMVRTPPFFFPDLPNGTDYQEWDLRDENTIAECLRHSDTVYNFVGRDFETKCALR
jgi:NADH dehydrogenase (ubiquinone) 1 alpha subcomplex subunit 9